MTCPPWTSTQNGQSPCTVVQQVYNSCNYTYGLISPLPSESSFIPTGSNVTKCTCSWASYNLISACMLCSSTPPSFVSWSQWTANCGGLTSTTYFPPGVVPLPNLLIPFYSTTNPSSYPDMTFSESIAADSAGSNNADVTPASSSTSPSPSSSNSSVTPVGAIAGGVIGGVVLLLLFCGFFLYFFCRKRRFRKERDSHEMTWNTVNGSHFSVRATKDINRAPLAPSGYPQTSAPMSTFPYSPVSNGMPGVPSTASLSSLRIASPTSQGHPVSVLTPPPAVLPMSTPINDAADVISPFLSQSPSRTANTSRNEKNARDTPESIPERATSPQSQRSRMNPPPYAPTSPTPSHVRSGSNASRRLSTSRHWRQGGGSVDTTITSVIGGHKRPRTHRMRTQGSVDSTGSMATTTTASDNGAGRSIRTVLERTTTSAASNPRGPVV